MMRYRDIMTLNSPIPVKPQKCSCGCDQGWKETLVEIPTELKIVLVTVASSYLMAKGSEPSETSQRRTLYMIGNGLLNLYAMELIKTTA